MANARAKKAARPAAKKAPRRRAPRKQMPPRRDWVFVEAQVDEDREERHVRALEFIAQFLDRIELQLERIADDIEIVMLED